MSISKFNHIHELFQEIDEQLTNKVHFYVVGGAVMLYHKLKMATKDIDILVDSPGEFKAAELALKKIGFKPKLPTMHYTKLDLSQILVRDDYRIDLFQKTICKGFGLSKNMKNRANTISQLNNLSTALCSVTDIFMLKTFTEREGDIQDCLLLAQKNIDWTALLKEIKEQITQSGQPVWITYIGERLDLLEDRNLVIPISKDINNLRHTYFDYLEKKSKKFPHP